MKKQVEQGESKYKTNDKSEMVNKRKSDKNT